MFGNDVVNPLILFKSYLIKVVKVLNTNSLKYVCHFLDHKKHFDVLFKVKLKVQQI